MMALVLLCSLSVVIVTTIVVFIGDGDSVDGDSFRLGASVGR
jgi:hypothetical protein